MAQTLTDREADVMRVLWDHGPCGVAEVREHLVDPLARNTVLTMLRILEEKGFVDHTEDGRAYSYFAVVAEHAARKNAIKHLVDKLFRGSSDLLFAHLVSAEDLKGEEIRELRDRIEKAPKSKQKKNET